MNSVAADLTLAIMTKPIQAILRSPAPTLFLSLFASQAAILVLSPMLTRLASDFGVSTASAGQLRTVSGISGTALAITLSSRAAGPGLRDLLRLGLGLLAAGSLASAIAPSFTLLAVAQLPIGAGVGITLSAGTAAAGAWAPEGKRAQLLSWTLAGLPASWIVGMPLAGLLTGVNWRWVWIAVPLPAAALALLAVQIRGAAPGDTASAHRSRIWRDGAVRGWAIGELLAFSAWAGTLVYAGALFIDSYDVSPRMAGSLLGAVALGYLPGTFLARRSVDGGARRFLMGLPIAAAAVVAAFGFARPAAGVSAGLLALLAFIAGMRTIAGSAFGLNAAPHAKVAIMGARAAAIQGGYLFGSLLGGVALTLGGFPALGATLATLFALAAVPHATVALRERSEAVAVEAAVASRAGSRL